MADILFKSAQIVADGVEMTADLAVTDGVVSAIGRLDDLQADETIDCNGMILLPGAVDLGVNLQADGEYDPPCRQDFSSMTREAAQGGATTVVCASRIRELSESESFDQRIAEQERHAFVDFGYHLMIEGWSKDRPGVMESAVERGISSFWVTRNGLLAGTTHRSLLYSVLGALPPNALVLTTPFDAELDHLMRKRLAANGGDVFDLFPEWFEAAAMAQYPFLMTGANSRLAILGVSAEASVDLLRQARESHGAMYGACSLAHLHFHDEFPGVPNLYPPVRSRRDVEALFAALEEGIMSAVISMHKPRAWSEASQALGQPHAAAPGISSIGHFYPLLFTEGVAKGRLSLTTLSLAAAADPAKLAGLYPKKGTLQIGSDADIVLINPVKTVTAEGPEELPMPEEHEPDELLDPFEGTEWNGAIEKVFLRGQKIMEDGECLKTARGLFQRRKLMMR